jgi:hypothetical protein
VSATVYPLFPRWRRPPSGPLVCGSCLQPTDVACLNWRHEGWQASALPTELSWRLKGFPPHGIAPPSWSPRTGPSDGV